MSAFGSGNFLTGVKRLQSIIHPFTEQPGLVGQDAREIQSLLDRCLDRTVKLKDAKSKMYKFRKKHNLEFEI